MVVWDHKKRLCELKLQSDLKKPTGKISIVLGPLQFCQSMKTSLTLNCKRIWRLKKNGKTDISLDAVIWNIRNMEWVSFLLKDVLITVRTVLSSCSHHIAHDTECTPSPGLDKLSRSFWGWIRSGILFAAPAWSQNISENFFNGSWRLNYPIRSMGSYLRALCRQRNEQRSFHFYKDICVAF